MKNSLRYLALLAVITGPAEAGSLAVTPGSGASIGMGTDGTNQLAASVICGATSSATLYATCLNQVFVNASGQMGITGPVTQSGTWTVQPGNTPNTTAWLVTGTGGTFPVTGTFWQTTQPISAASLPLPTGASTSANQPTAATLGSTTSGQTGTVAIGAVTTAAPTYSTTQSNALSLNTSGGLRVDGSGVTQPVSASSLPLPTGAATSANQEVTAAGSSASSAQGVQGVTGGVALPVSASALPLPTGAATSALQTTGNTTLSTINTTLGSPFQAGASIGNTTFAATQATAGNLNATVVGTGTFSTQLTGATNNINNIAGTISLPTGASTSALQTTGNTSLSTIATNTTPPINITATACSGTITTGGTAQSAITAQSTLHGFTIANVDASAGSGEPLWISFTTTAAASGTDSWPLAAPTTTSFSGMGSYTTPPGFGLNHAVSVIAATTGHKFSCTWW